MSKKISVITINYNNLEGLKKTVESVMNQTWKEWEYIIIDGGSTDGSVAYLKTQNNEITYWISEKDKGVYHAMNKGIANASGEYLLFLNSGDHFYNNNVLQECNSFIKEKDLIFFDMNFDDKIKSWIDIYPSKIDFHFFITNTLPHPATFIKRDLFNRAGFYDEELKIVSDWKFFTECVCEHNCTYLKIDKTLSTFYADGLSSDPQNRKLLYKERLLFLKSKFSFYLKDISDSEVKKEIVKTYLRTLKRSLIIEDYHTFFGELIKIRPIKPLLRLKLLLLGISYMSFGKGLVKYSKLLKV